MSPRRSLRCGRSSMLGSAKRALNSGSARPRVHPSVRASPCRSLVTKSSTDEVSNTATRKASASKSSASASATATTATLLVLSGLLVFSLGGQRIRLDAQREPSGGTPSWVQNSTAMGEQGKSGTPSERQGEDGEKSDSKGVGAWFSDIGSVDWGSFSDRITDFLLPEWSKMLPIFARKLQLELGSAPGSLAEEIWHEAHDPSVNPEIQYTARVRVSNDLCDEEKAFRDRRKTVTAAALAKYLELPEDEEVNPDDVPVIALCGSGGGLRALVAGTGSLMAVQEAGLFDCVTYTAGVSGSCWLQALYFASFTQQNFHRVADHLRSRLGVHIAHPPEAFTLLTTAPTNKYLLGGAVERFKAYPETAFGLVDVYGTLLAARLLVPRGELGVSPLDFKISNQRRHLTQGAYPMPIYTAVRHEIPELDADGEDTGKRKPKVAKEKKASESGKEEAQKKAWFQWFEITPYEFFCEEFAAGIPTWAMGRKFNRGQDIPLPPTPSSRNENDYRPPEVRLPLMLGIFGSAFCATLSHYYKEIRPLVQSIGGMTGLDEMIWGRSDDLGKVHPIEPATLPNPIYGMNSAHLPDTVPPGLLLRQDIQLMDAGMSNNLPLYPFMRPGRGVEVVIVFDASADIRKDNWLYVADGYARRRGVKGWPMGVGWPPSDDPPEKTAQQLEDAAAGSKASGPDGKTPDDKLTQAKVDQAVHKMGDEPHERASKTGNKGSSSLTEAENAKVTAKELGYCTVWVGSAEEKVAAADQVKDDSPASSEDGLASAPPIDESTHWRLADPDAGLTLVYLPYLANEKKVPGVNPATSEYMSTWNFVYKPEEVDNAVALAKANYAEGADQIRATVRAVYERKKKLRLAAAEQNKKERYRRLIQLGKNDKLDGDHFNI